MFAKAEMNHEPKGVSVSTRGDNEELQEIWVQNGIPGAVQFVPRSKN